MPHDRNGRRLQIGDRVLVPCTVTSLTGTDSYCNIVVITEEPMHPSEAKTIVSLNTKQVLYVESAPATASVTPVNAVVETVPTASEGAED